MVGVAPEVLSGVPYDLKVDVWSLGVILYELLTLKHPFSNSSGSPDSFNRLHDATVDFEDAALWQDTSQVAKDLVKKMLCKDPSQRLSI